MRFTPSNFGQRSPPTYYRGCWHVVSRGLFKWYRQISSHLKEVYRPRSFILHAASLHQAFAHCARFLIAAPRRSLGRISVPIRLIVLSDQLPVEGLVGHYPTNYLIGRKPISKRINPLVRKSCEKLTTCGISSLFRLLSPTLRQVAYVLRDRSPLGPDESSPRSTCIS